MAGSPAIAVSIPGREALFGISAMLTGKLRAQAFHRAISRQLIPTAGQRVTYYITLLPMRSIYRAFYAAPEATVDLVEDLIRSAAEAARAAHRANIRAARLRRSKPRLTLRPGANTPLWNELVRQIRPHLRKYGSKAQLARLLGLPRQRLQDCLKAGSASLDAERTLQLIGWLGFFQRGGRLAPVIRVGRAPRGRGSRPVPASV